MEPFRNNSYNFPTSLSQIQNKELYIPLYIKDPETDEFEVVSMPVKYEKLVELFYTKSNKITKEDREIEKIFQSGRCRTKRPRDNISSKHANTKPNPRTLGISLNHNHGLIDSFLNNDHNKFDAAATFFATPPSAEIDYQQNNSKLPGNFPVSVHFTNKLSDNTKVDYRSVNITDNIIHSFLTEFCLESSTGLVSRNELQNAYRSWSQLRGQPHIAGSIIAEYLDPLYQTTKIKKKTYYVGLRLK